MTVLVLGVMMGRIASSVDGKNINVVIMIRTQATVLPVETQNESYTQNNNRDGNGA